MESNFDLSQNRLQGDIRGTIFAMFSATVCGLTVYWSIINYDPWVTDYHAKIADGLYFFSALLLVPVLLNPKWIGNGVLENVKPWFSWWAALVCSAWLALPNISSLLHLKLYFAIFFFGLVLKLWFRLATNSVRQAVLLAILLAHVAILQLVLMAWHRNDMNLPQTYTWLPYHGNIRHVAYHGMLAACCGFALGTAAGRFRLVGYLGALVALFGLAYFGARGALLAWMASAVVIAYLLAAKRVMVTASLLLALSLGLASVANDYWRKSPVAGTVTSRIQTGDVLDSGRIAIWRQSSVAIRENPIFGYGPDGYRTSECCTRQVVQPHNVLIQLLLESGLVGLAAAIWLVWKSFRQSISDLMKDRALNRSCETQVCLAGTICGFFVYSLIDGLFFHAVPLLVFAIITALFSEKSTRLKN